MTEYDIMWWNLENLFDIEGAQNRSEKLSRTLNQELKGWTTDLLDKKIDQLSKIITKTNNEIGPDLLGVCEVENHQVLEKLANSLKNKLSRNYHIVHSETQDRRGIDVAFVYDKDKFEVEKNMETGEELVFSHFIVKRESTRDLLQVNFKTKSLGRRLVLIGNHWPSRGGGQYESEPYRIVAGESLSYFHKRILETNSKDEDGDTAIIAMGDFNDEPFNRSITDYALSTGSFLKVKLSFSPRFYNLMWNLMTNSIGTYYFNNIPNVLDQIMVSKGIATAKNFKIKDNSTKIVKYEEMIEGQYETPLKFGRPSNNSLNEKGFSDHFPISTRLEEI